MAAPIVYEGALAPKDPSRNGLFKGMKFWVAHRVPMRLNYVQSIQDNGGKVVSLDKTADYLISDHLRKDCPPGSYTYKLIEDSIKAGTLQNLDDYLCVPKSRSGPSIPAASQKNTRTAFTAEDDLILTRWIMKAEREGDALSGLKIYKELEKKHPHHSYQSWNARWVKKLQHLPRPEIPEILNKEPSPPATKQTAKTTPHSLSPLRSGTSGRISAAPRGRAKFTADDDDILIQHIRECIRQNQSIKGNKIFRDLANDFPQHSDQSWRARWINQLEPKLAHKVAQWKSGTIEEEPPDIQKSPQTQKSVADDADASHSSHVVNDAPAPAVIPTTDEVEEAENQDQSNVPAAVHTPPPALDEEPTDPFSDIDESPSDNVLMEDQFRRDYQAFVEAEGLQVVPFYTIKGKTFDPWQLWNAVASQKVEPDERDWQQIAEKLGFDWVQHETVHDEVRECYEKYLSAFEELLQDFNDESEDDEEEEEEDDQHSEAPLPSSPPMMPSLKRSFDTHRLSYDHVYPQSPPKRRKIDKNTEIPSTPDHVNGTSTLRRQTGDDVTPNAQCSTQSIVDYEAKENESRDILHDLPTIPRGKRKVLEPETQDFRFDAETQQITFETQGNAEIKSQCNITPSQQLREESDAISPDIANASPTPKARTYRANQAALTRKKLIQNPFSEDSDGEPSQPAAEDHIDHTSTNASPSVKAKRRSLPKTFTHNRSPVASASTSVPSRARAKPSSPGQPQSVPRPTPVKETPEDIIDRFCSLGYPRKIVLQALRATTWHLGDAGQVMEILKRGEELPQRTHGVWTQRDDDALKLMTLDEPPKDEKEERKRARARKRLEEKHGLDLMELRRKYLWEVV
ncbi:TRF2-interacting telomeric protein/Rap1 C terminal domain-containing protein [Jackrogersella minutella]|nr:TRF2-interacting telomeric protein/Rap1 C terminal domain-containing protein [Jackrogersella minutella]